jgi:hypothetical protein
MQCDLCGQTGLAAYEISILRSDEDKEYKLLGHICFLCRASLIEQHKVVSPANYPFRLFPAKTYLSLIELFGIKVLNYENKL